MNHLVYLSGKFIIDPKNRFVKHNIYLRGKFAM